MWYPFFVCLHFGKFFLWQNLLLTVCLTGNLCKSNCRQLQIQKINLYFLLSFASLLIRINVIIYQNTFGYLTLYICNKTSRTRDVSSYCFLILRPKSKMPFFLSFRYVLLWKNNHFETRSALTYFYYRITWMNIPIDVTWLLLVVKISCISLH